ncbi:hypothetical protein TNCV_1401081 [Trichonephila clavipes]|nr:hypothetical protein TNCV_1401081 [Trichonephila clavipes]
MQCDMDGKSWVPIRVSISPFDFGKKLRENRRNQKNMLGGVLEHDTRLVEFRPWTPPPLEEFLMFRDADCCAVRPGFRSWRGLDVCKCTVPLGHGGTVNSHRAASRLVRLVEGEERIFLDLHQIVGIFALQDLSCGLNSTESPTEEF